MAMTTSLSQEKCGEALDAFVDTIRLAAKYDESVTIPGFGRFETFVVPAHSARNPKTGEDIWVDEVRRVSFRMGKKLKQLLNVADS